MAMVMPVRCVTCGFVLADKQRYFEKERAEEGVDVQKLLDKLGLKRICCRRHMLCHVDVM
jgi:DNA-directed RNA polymerase subunit N (RpoN/RPB10)